VREFAGEGAQAVQRDARLLDGLFDYTGPAALEVTRMAFLVAITFGLATDYAVLVMAGIKEQHDLGMWTVMNDCQMMRRMTSVMIRPMIGSPICSRVPPSSKAHAPLDN